MFNLYGSHRQLSPQVVYWLKNEERQNFGDYLTELFLHKALLAPRVAAAAYRLIGSAINDAIIRDDLVANDAARKGAIAYWGCGARDDARLNPKLQARCIFLGIRGPLSRDRLGLPADTAIGDPGFLTPLLYKPSVNPRLRGTAICVPHFHDAKTDDELLAVCGADYLVRPWIENSLDDLFRILDDIASADFVLAGSLHAAIVACAYDVPFGFWDNGHVDIPFKWRDTAASLNITACFVDNVADGRKVYDSVIKRRLVKPLLSPILDVAPFHVRPEVLARAAEADDVYTAGRNAGNIYPLSASG